MTDEMKLRKRATFSGDLTLSGSDRLQNSEALLDPFWALLRTIDEPS